MSQTIKQRVALSSLYSHDPNHFRFPRTSESYPVIEECGDKYVGWVSVVIAIVFFVIWPVFFN